ncbi:oxygenase MpaB family protein [Marinoscillum sp. MHG1-6]|uniref:oxygenase MpaB family protein n=1 Tax=Marinoscillum sp. MHG1-6 TaxID=2959627 RepID=UPI00215854CD|nr:oxygenase MpaB family protein [Marinoscillum sp. MHG1-6]
MLAIDHLNADLLDQKRKETDPLADQAVSAIIEGGFERHINDVFLKLTRNQDYDPALFSDLPKEVQEIVDQYFEATARLPEWADQSKIAVGQEVFSLYGPEVFMLLNLKSLPMCYTCAKGAKVLYDTGRLMEHGGKIDPLVRRLMETAQMVVDVLQPDGLKPKGKGIVTMQKVRLIHASIRYFIKNERFNPKGWDVSEFGEPINQEDLAGTLMSFSPIILSGLKQLGIKLSQEQIDGYSHCWKVIGYQMGISDDLLSDNYEDNWVLGCKILEHQSAASEEGKALTDSCIAFIQYMIPGHLFQEVPEYLMWYLFQDVEKGCAKPLASMIGLKEHKTLQDEFALTFSKILGEGFSIMQHSKIISSLASKINKLLLQGYIKHHNEGKNVRFFIPPSLHGSWGLVSETDTKNTFSA